MAARCEPISNLKFDQKSAREVKTIKTRLKAGNALATALSTGVMAKIFIKSGPLQSAYNISQTNWTTYSRAMRAVPLIDKEMIRKKSAMMILHYQTHYNKKLLAFWEGLYHGCR